MAAQIIPFPSRVPAAQAPVKKPEFRQKNTQDQARRIVAQVEQEIASQQYQRTQMRLQFTPLPEILEIETPTTVARRILKAILSFARPA